MPERSTVRLVCFATLLSVAIGFHTSAGAAVIAAIGGKSQVTGELGDYASGDGTFWGAILYLGFGEQTFATLGVRSGKLGSDSTDWLYPTSFTVDMGIAYYLGERSQHRFRPFLGGQVGTGRVRWDYSLDAQTVTQVPDDSIVFFYLAPEVGLEIKVAERFDIRGGARYLMTLYDRQTRQRLSWDIDGGNFAEVWAGIGISI